MYVIVKVKTHNEWYILEQLWYSLCMLYDWPEDDQIRSKHDAIIKCIIHTSCVWWYLSPSLTLSWPAGHICPTYKESFQVRWDNSIPLFLHAPIYLQVSLFRWTCQNAFSRKTVGYKWYCVKCRMQHCTQCHLYMAVSWENAFWLVQQNRDTSRQMTAWRKSGILLS